MSTLPHLFYILLAFGVIALAARQIGEFFTRLRLPLDTLVLSVHRKDDTIISYDYTQPELGIA